jgi:hypothetical protein
MPPPATWRETTPRALRAGKSGRAPRETPPKVTVQIDKEK